MSFDTIEARKIVSALRSRERMPGGDIMKKGGDALDSAIQDAMQAMGQIRSAEAEALKYRTEYEKALLDIKGLRDKEKELTAAVALLQGIAKNVRGASKRATEWLLSVGKMPEEKKE